MKRYSFIYLLFIAIWLVSGCQADTTTTIPTEEKVAIPSATATIAPTPTKIPISALSIEEILERILSGEGNFEEINTLSFEQQKAFSIALNEYKNEQRGDNPVIFTDETGAKFYIDPITGGFLPVNNGTTAKEQTITMYIPRVIDSEGYTHVFYEAEWIKIEGSQNIQFDNFENFNWPDTETVDPQWVPKERTDLLGLTIPEYNYFATPGRESMIPIFFPKKNVGSIDIVGFGPVGTVIGYAINEIDRFSVMPVVIIGRPSLFEENLRADSSYTITEESDFFKKIEINTLYYLMYGTNQKERFASNYPSSDGKEITANYEGLVPTSQSHNVITGKTKSDDLVLIKATLVVKAGRQPDN